MKNQNNDNEIPSESKDGIFDLYDNNSLNVNELSLNEKKKVILILKEELLPK